jgi:dGTPase
MKNLFKNYAMNIENPKWENVISRTSTLNSRSSDFRTDFDRDYTRIIHSNAYRRLKHKTQVFFSPENDHICTRGEHVTHVESISYTIANYLGLNTELTKAIAVGHDLGHSPFGHAGERILSEISKRDLGISFWHEKNGLHFVDSIELLEGHNGYYQNLNLTYGVRDGIISHCGEIDENALKPREDFIDLNDYVYPNQYAPYTWEGCVVKISDKISYIGRDIEDAISLGILDNHLQELYDLLNYSNSKEKINNSSIINYLVCDLCENSSPEKGLCFSDEAFELMNKIKDFNYKNIYFSDRLKPSMKFFDLVINEIYNTLKQCFDYENSLNKLQNLEKFYPKLSCGFYHFLENYCDFADRKELKLNNKIIFDYKCENDFYKAILSYISGMTDNFAIEIYNEIIGF